MNEDQSTRDRVRALVKDVLANAIIVDEDQPAQSPLNPRETVAPFSELNSVLAKEPAAETFAEQDFDRREFDRDESAKNLLTEDDLRGLETGARLRVRENVRFTALAADVIRDKRIELVTKSANAARTTVKTVALGADHGGFEFKEQLKEFLAKQNLQIRDFGTNSTDTVDYPDFAFAVANAVAAKQADIGIVIDGAGIGSAITANKVAGARAAACYNQALARNSREHNGANVLTLGSKQNTFQEVCEIVTAFLTTDLTEERHRKRVEKIAAIERQSLK